METKTKQGRGRPIGKVVNWSKIPVMNWKYMTDRRISDVLGTSVVNVFSKRRRLIKKKGDSFRCIKPKWTRHDAKRVRKSHAKSAAMPVKIAVDAPSN